MRKAEEKAQLPDLSLHVLTRPKYTIKNLFKAEAPAYLFYGLYASQAQARHGLKIFKPPKLCNIIRQQVQFEIKT